MWLAVLQAAQVLQLLLFFARYQRELILAGQFDCRQILQALLDLSLLTEVSPDMVRLPWHPHLIQWDILQKQ